MIASSAPTVKQDFHPQTIAPDAGSGAHRIDAPEVKILAVNEKRTHYLRALIDIQYAGLNIFGLQVIAEPKQRAWLAWPSCSGCYRHIVRPATPEVHRLIKDACIEAWLRNEVEE